VPQQRLVPRLGLAQPREAVARLGDDQKVDGRLRVDVAQREALVVLVDYIRRDLLGDDAVKDRGAVAVGLAVVSYICMYEGG
jgi:hypothetical protein